MTALYFILLHFIFSISTFLVGKVSKVASCGIHQQLWLKNSDQSNNNVYICFSRRDASKRVVREYEVTNLQYIRWSQLLFDSNCELHSGKFGCHCFWLFKKWAEPPYQRHLQLPFYILIAIMRDQNRWPTNFQNIFTLHSAAAYIYSKN